ncbi:MAG: PQQ-binding-like beta-propeller repeat protein [Candidatus Bathyarchaeota archaeon]|nr:PQQ-binding-like beta-propeller repeat protein [Candidatus Bathyarchaeota archaeon]
MAKVNWAVLFLVVFLITPLLSAACGQLGAQTFASNDDWPMFRHDSTHTGAVTNSSLIVPNELWRFAEGTSNNIFISSSASVVNGIVYIGSNYNAVNHRGGSIYALDAYTGVKIWDFSTNGSIYSSPAVWNNILFVGGAESNFYALNALTGAKLWSTKVFASYSSPCVVDGVVYVGSIDGNVYAFDACSGEKIWNYTTGDSVGSSPALHGGVVYVGSNDHNVYALDAKDGSKIWNFSTGGIVHSSPAVSGGVVYVGSGDSTLYALDSSTGTKLWSYPYKTHVRDVSGIQASPAVADGFVFFVASDHVFYALNAATGSQVWNVTKLSVDVSSPVVADGLVYVCVPRGFLAFNASTGATIQTYVLKDIANAKIIDGHWQVITGYGLIKSSPTISNGVIYFTSENGNLYAIGEPIIQPSTDQVISGLDNYVIWIILAALTLGISIVITIFVRNRKAKHSG